jgi:hypothetical protein
MARPSSYTPEIGNLICELMAEGKGLRQVCEAEHMPSRNTVMRWVEANDVFRGQYARAREAMYDWIAEEAIRIADDSSGDYFIEDRNGQSVVVPDHARVQRSRLQVDTRRWLLSKLSRRYGDRPEPAAEHEGVTEIRRIIIGWEDRHPEPPEPPKLIEHDPGPLPRRVDPEILIRLVEMIKQRVPKADQRSPEAVLDEVMAVIDRALLAEYGALADASSA